MLTPDQVNQLRTQYKITPPAQGGVDHAQRLNDFKSQYGAPAKTESNYWNNQDSGVLPYDKINEALAPTSMEGDTKFDAGKTAGNFGKSLLKSGVAFAGFFDPIVNVKKIIAAGKEAVGYTKDVAQAAKMQMDLQDINKHLESRIAQAKTQGQDTSRLEAALQANLSLPGFDPGTDLKNATNEAIAKFALPPAVQQGIEAGKQSGVGEGIYQGVKSIAEDPYQLLPYGLTLKGAVGKGGSLEGTKLGGAIDTGVSKVGGLGGATKLATDAVGKGASVTIRGATNLANNLAKFGTSQATGMSQETISRILSNPQDFSPEAMHQFTREGVASKAVSDINNRLQDLSDTGREYKGVRDAQIPVKIPPGTFEGVLQKHGIGVDPNGKLTFSKESTPTSSGDQAALQNWYDTYGKDAEHSSNSFLNARKGLDNLAAFDTTKTDAANVLARDLRKSLNDTGRSQIPGLNELDAKFAAETAELKKVKVDYFNKDGTLKDNAISKIANLSNKGRDVVLDRLEKISPGIGEQVRTLKAVEDIQAAGGQKVGAYARLLAPGAAGYAVGGPVGAIVAAILSSPAVATKILRGYGKMLGIKDSVVNKAIGDYESNSPKASPKTLPTNTQANTVTKKLNIESSIAPPSGPVKPPNKTL